MSKITKSQTQTKTKLAETVYSRAARKYVTREEQKPCQLLFSRVMLKNVPIKSSVERKAYLSLPYKLIFDTYFTEIL